MRLVTGHYVTLDRLNELTLDDVDDLNITLEAEARAERAWRKQHAK